MMRYRTDCGMEFNSSEHTCKKDVYLERKLIKGNPPKNRDIEIGINKKCKECAAVKEKIDKQLNIEDGTIFKTKVKYCEARSITPEERYWLLLDSLRETISVSVNDYETREGSFERLDELHRINNKLLKVVKMSKDLLLNLEANPDACGIMDTVEYLEGAIRDAEGEK
jgi:hypothetical protein